MLKILCVFRAKADGGSRGFSTKSVDGLYRGITKNITIPHKLYCLSDVDTANNIPLEHHWPRRGWWSKIELFKHKGPVLYFDLDTMIIANIDDVARYVLSLKVNDFLCLRPYKYSGFNRVSSCLMGWNGDYSFIYDRFKNNVVALLKRFRGDQTYIWDSIRKRGDITLRYCGDHARCEQSVIKGIYYYDTRQDAFLYPDQHYKQPPDDARIIISGGMPRFEEVSKPQWIVDYYNA